MSGYLIGQHCSRRNGSLRGTQWPRRDVSELPATLFPLRPHTHITHFRKAVDTMSFSNKVHCLNILISSEAEPRLTSNAPPRMASLCLCTVGAEWGKTSGSPAPERSEPGRHRPQSPGSRPGMPVLLPASPLGEERIPPQPMPGSSRPGALL